MFLTRFTGQCLFEIHIQNCYMTNSHLMCLSHLASTLILFNYKFISCTGVYDSSILEFQTWFAPPPSKSEGTMRWQRKCVKTLVVLRIFMNEKMGASSIEMFCPPSK